MFFALQGVALYAILAGADFGAGIWQLRPGAASGASASASTRITAMAPVWEANHVWLIFVLVVVWTGYPRRVRVVASTLAIALTAAGLGIILRGVAYALRSASAGRPPRRAPSTR